MRRLNLILTILILPITVIAQYRGGISLSGGIATEGLTFSASYFHPLVIRQFYIVGGFDYLKKELSVTDDIYHLYFSKVSQAFFGVRIGDYLFAIPKISYNWYGKYESVGWGIAAGLLWRPTDHLSLGFSVGHDQIRFDSSVDQYGPAQYQSISLIINYQIDL